MADPRSDLATALSGKLAPAQLEKLLDEVLASTKRVNADWTCKFCKKTSRATVEVSDAKAVVNALTDLLNQGYGRPAEASGTDDEKIIFKRIVKTSGPDA